MLHVFTLPALTFIASLLRTTAASMYPPGWKPTLQWLLLSKRTENGRLRMLSNTVRIGCAEFGQSESVVERADRRACVLRHLSGSQFGSDPMRAPMTSTAYAGVPHKATEMI